ncbi:Cellulose synthase family protein [Salix suchowensis]|nr:Cellulose synthase family protein [Salix suchowensis]
MAITEEPILARLDRLDNMMRELEELRGCNRSPRSSCPSTPSSGTLTSGGKVSFVDLSPKSLEKHCRPISYVMMETEVKGTLIERLDHVEERVMKLCVQLEDGFEADRHREGKTEGRKHRKGLRGLVKKYLKNVN